MEISEKILKIEGVFKHYDWGGKTFLPSLMHRSNEEGRPYAEYWLGSDLHSAAGSLPYLFKVQDVEKMLSIQVHPSKGVAIKKFAEEDREGIPRDAPHRNYKDENHKPELLSPLGTFFLLHGFKPAEELSEILRSVPELNFLAKEFADANYRSLYTAVMTMPQDDVNRVLRPLIDRITPLYLDGKLSKNNEYFWAARAAITFPSPHVDRGIFSIFLFNIVQMEEGDGLFQPAGLPHAYLEGRTMEIMANSDNVLRGGLTPKHVDVPELLANIQFEATIPAVIKAGTTETHEEVYHTPAEDFQMSRIIVEPDRGISLNAVHPDIYFIYAGMGLAKADEEIMSFRSGDALLALPGTVVHFSTDAKAVIYRATVPSASK